MATLSKELGINSQKADDLWHKSLKCINSAMYVLSCSGECRLLDSIGDAVAVVTSVGNVSASSVEFPELKLQ